MVTWFKARCAGGGNVTFGVYIYGFRALMVMFVRLSVLLLRCVTFKLS